MNEDEIISKALCGQCKNFNDFIDVTTCELGRVKEFQEDGGLTECRYWEARRSR